MNQGCVMYLTTRRKRRVRASTREDRRSDNTRLSSLPLLHHGGAKTGGRLVKSDLKLRHVDLRASAYLLQATALEERVVDDNAIRESVGTRRHAKEELRCRKGHPNKILAVAREGHVRPVGTLHRCHVKGDGSAWLHETATPAVNVVKTGGV